MLSFKALSNYIKNQIQEVVQLYGYEFHLVAGTGKYKPPKRNGASNSVTEYINGRLAVISGETSTTQTGIEFSTKNTLFQIIIPLGYDEDDGGITELNTQTGATTTYQQFQGNETKLNNIRDSINAVFARNTSTQITEGNKTYTISIIYQPLQDGERAIVQKLGKSYVFNSYINFVIVESGIASRDAVFYLNGYALPYDVCTIAESNTADAYVLADGKAVAQTIGTQGTLGFTFQLPALVNNCVKMIISQALNGDVNVGYLLRCNMGNNGDNGENAYLVTITSTEISSQMNLNVGITIAFAPLLPRYDLITPSNGLYVYDLTSQNTALSQTITGGFSLYDFKNRTAHYNNANTSKTVKLPYGANAYVFSTSKLSGLTSLAGGA